MGYSKEIVVYQNPNLVNSQICKLYKRLIISGWSIEDRYNTNKISYSLDSNEGYQFFDFAKEKSSFEELLKSIEEQNKWISFRISNPRLQRIATIFHSEYVYRFDLEIYRGEEEYDWFKKFDEEIQPVVKDDFFLNKIEWRNNYGNEIVRCQTDLNHEGVLILASSNRLKNFFRLAPFEYEFPKGIETLLKSNSIVAIQANDSRFETIIDLDNIIFEQTSISGEIQFDGKKDKLLILNHADFTMICSKHEGDYEKYGWKHVIDIPIDSEGRIKFKIWMENGRNNSKLIFKRVYSGLRGKGNDLIHIDEIPTHNTVERDHTAGM